MRSHAFGKPIRDFEGFIKPVRKKLEQYYVANLYFVHAICPIDEHAAPYHDKQYREVYPMKPPDGQWMFFYDFFHLI